MKSAVFFLIAIGFLGGVQLTASAQSKARVRFARGATSAVVTATVRGYGYKDYVVGASSGQEMKVKVNGGASTVFTIFQPGGENLDGATEMDEFNATLPTSGDYVIRVMMMRSAARRPHSVSNYTLKISIK